MRIEVDKILRSNRDFGVIAARLSDGKSTYYSWQIFDDKNKKTKHLITKVTDFDIHEQSYDSAFNKHSSGLFVGEFIEDDMEISPIENPDMDWYPGIGMMFYEEDNAKIMSKIIPHSETF